ncbi:ribonuclease HII [Schleiferilactobacillus shenzhenensis]|uniref:Ribonuclease HII n=1 Tax=Schleiferilactobacillus shenzhenensis LY-73 TaxID=1231336 RepID=U4TZ46_9LACO|nr:ribonuclease HII [Schleiferilactobacillus shenzhenensis]ERL66587.1 RnhB [Schleiferilactobacillus shenzhenensis LY-73]
MTPPAKHSLTALRQALAAGTLAAADIAALAEDPRAGAQQLYARYQRHQAHQAAAAASFAQRLQFEQDLWPQYPQIAGIDEVGRGPLAGPVITCAVVFPRDVALDQDLVAVNDSKQLTPAKRLALFNLIMAEASDVALGLATAAEIDQHNIYHATEIAMARAVAALWHQPDYLLVDAMHVPVAVPQCKLIKGDARSVSIGAASIIAKVCRDRLMDTYDSVYPGYGFRHNAGYGTAEHLAGLQAYGVTPIHRRSFAPVQAALHADK